VNQSLDAFKGQPQKVSFQGVPGAYSNMACKAALPGWEVHPCHDFDEAFAAVKDGLVTLAMIPIENSTAGRVADIHHLMPGSGLHIIGEHFQPVEHQLLVNKGVKLEDIKEVRSHEQALSQCRDKMRAMDIEPVKYPDTAGAAQDLAHNPRGDGAAIASRLAAELYDLDIVLEDVGDQVGNTTRFVVLSREAIRPVQGERNAITSLVFRVKSHPAALYKALGGFATNGVNITKLESYLDSEFTVAQFYVDLEGHIDDEAMQYALKELKYFGSYDHLGTYPANEFRQKAGK
jgi:prephenate dehydratase